MKFSERIGVAQVRKLLQVEDMDSDLTNRLWNVIYAVIDSLHDRYKGQNNFSEVATDLWKNFFKLPMDVLVTYEDGTIVKSGFVKRMREWYFKAPWYAKYDLIEYLVYPKSPILAEINEILQEEKAGYRFLGDKLVPITSEIEIESIERAVRTTDIYRAVNTHINQSLKLLSDKKNPDYRNSIKEAISAVESLCILISGDKKATLGVALTKIEKQYKFHGALKESFSKLYGYTSDASGIRHALLEDDIAVTFEDAKFMLVSCSAFINYLLSKAPVTPVPPLAEV